MTTETTAAAPPPRAPKTFIQTLADHHYGHTADEATAKLSECIATSERTGKQTELVIKLVIKPVSKGGRYDVTADVTSKLPTPPREAAIMFVGPDGNLTNRDPRQQELPGLRVATAPTEPAVRVEQDAAPAAGIRVV